MRSHHTIVMYFFLISNIWNISFKQCLFMVYITHYIWSSSEKFSKAVHKHRKPFPNRFLQCKKKNYVNLTLWSKVLQLHFKRLFNQFESFWSDRAEMFMFLIKSKVYLKVPYWHKLRIVLWHILYFNLSTHY